MVELTVNTHRRKSFKASINLLSGCVFYGRIEHPVNNSRRFGKLSPEIRQKDVKKNLLCLNSLKECKCNRCETVYLVFV